jgi:NADP-dependent 3-hydroxy acid dehydrogenase YdfG
VTARQQPAGLVVAVTGGARGIGLATARALSAAGATVAIGDIDGPLASSAAAELGGLGAPVDVTRRESFAAFLGTVADRLGPVDVLVNNAGVLRVGPFLEEDDEWTRRQVDVNLLGVILGMKLALPAMVARGSGHVVNVASAAARTGVAREAVYSATKHAVLGLSEALRAEMRGTGVKLSVVMPGLVRTELAAGTLDAPGTVVLAPERVADAIVGVVRRPRFEVYVPRSYGRAAALGALLPRGTREALLRALGSERATARTTPEQRAEYEGRVEAQAAREGSWSARS